MCDKSSRMIIKQGSGVPTIPPSADHRNGDWIATDIYEGEFYQDTDTGLVYTRSGGNIFPAGQGSDNFANADLLLTGNRTHNLDGNTLTFFGGFSTFAGASTGYTTALNVVGYGTDPTLTVNNTNPTTVSLDVVAGFIRAQGLPTYASDAAAGVGGLTIGMFYQTSTGELRIKL